MCVIIIEIEEARSPVQIGIVHKYVRRDIIFNVPICSGDNIGQYDLDYVFIATNPGKNEALSALKNKYGETYSEHCAVVSTLMKS